MLPIRAALRGGFFFAALAALCLAGCPSPAPAKPAPPPHKVAVLYYLPETVLLKTQLSAAVWAQNGVSELVVPLAPDLAYGLHTGPLSLDLLRTRYKAIVQAANGIPVRLVLTPSNPESQQVTRSFSTWTDDAGWNALAANLTTVGQACREAGISWVLWDTEINGPRFPYQDPAICYPKGPEKLIRQRAQLVRAALLKGHPGLHIGALGCCRQERPCPGFGPFFRALVPDVWLEELYLYAVDTKPRPLLDEAQRVTGARTVAAGWWAGTGAADVPTWLSAQRPRVQELANAGPCLFVFQDSAKPGAWFTDKPPANDALGAVLRTVAP